MYTTPIYILYTHPVMQHYTCLRRHPSPMGAPRMPVHMVNRPLVLIQGDVRIGPIAPYINPPVIPEMELVICPSPRPDPISVTETNLLAFRFYLPRGGVGILDCCKFHHMQNCTHMCSSEWVLVFSHSMGVHQGCCSP